MFRNVSGSKKIFRRLKWYYLIIDFLVILFPILLSFDKRVAFYKSWKGVFASSILIGIPFLIWDYFFTLNNIWSFNSTYITGVHLLNLPIEEILFFVVVPFACTFIYECIKYYFQNLVLHTFNKIASFLFIIFYSFVIYKSTFTEWYTLSVLCSAALIFILVLLNMKRFPFIWFSFIVSLAPFILVNGILTGSMIDGAIVQYNDVHNLKIRLFTIPIEDILYSFTLLNAVFLLHEYFHKKNRLNV